jgi:hypothetical protein
MQYCKYCNEAIYFRGHEVYYVKNKEPHKPVWRGGRCPRPKPADKSNGNGQASIAVFIPSAEAAVGPAGIDPIAEAGTQSLADFLVKLEK